jgi:hypothetical protein
MNNASLTAPLGRFTMRISMHVSPAIRLLCRLASLAMLLLSMIALPVTKDFFCFLLNLVQYGLRKWEPAKTKTAKGKNSLMMFYSGVKTAM